MSRPKRIYSSPDMIKEIDRIKAELEMKDQREISRIDTTKAIAKPAIIIKLASLAAIPNLIFKLVYHLHRLAHLRLINISNNFIIGFYCFFNVFEIFDLLWRL